MRNYIPDLNPFHLAGPPSWWLRQLWDFDDSLVVVPSRQSMVYRLAQRRKLSLPENLVNDALFKDSDTRMLASYSLIPVTTIIPTANWSNPYIFVELRNRAPHRLGGAEKVNKMLEDREWQDQIDKAEREDDRLTRTAKDAWKYYKTKIGVRGTYDLGTLQPQR